MSGRVFLTDLDDFIAPGQACVNPLVSAKLNENEKSENNKNTVELKGRRGASGGNQTKKFGRVTLETDGSTSAFGTAAVFAPTDDFLNFDGGSEPNLILASSGSNAKRVATVSLNDCLACSGCVTSAEAVLIQEQSTERFFSLVEEWKSVQEESDKPILVVVLSPNSVASLAQLLGWTSVPDLYLRLAAWLKVTYGVKYVLDGTAGGDVALMESRAEFMNRLNARPASSVDSAPVKKVGVNKDWVKPDVYTTAVSSSSQLIVKPNTAADAIAPPTAPDTVEIVPTLSSKLPMFTSHCPGWVCYAEKTTPQAIPYMSTVKSAQQIVGTITKSIVSLLLANSDNIDTDALNGVTYDLLHPETAWLAKKLGTTPPQIEKRRKVKVISIQPCFDKKLEASRRDFHHSESDEPEVDLVLSTGELWQLLCSSDSPDSVSHILDEKVVTVDDSVVDLHKHYPQVYSSLNAVTPDPFNGSDAYEALFRCVSADSARFLAAAENNMGSGGYAEYLFRYCAKELYGLDINDALEYTAGRNTDVHEIDLHSILSNKGVSIPSEKPNLRFARAYGFRNVQSVMMKMRRGVYNIDLVELMACPSGCNNGGGQLKSRKAMTVEVGNQTIATTSESPAEGKTRVEALERTFHSVLQSRQPDDSPLVQFLYGPNRLNSPLSTNSQLALHTQYHAVPKLEEIAPLATKW